MKKISVCLIILCAMLGKNAWADNTNDPYERYNRVAFSFNEKAGKYVLTPVGNAYRTVVPLPARQAVRNFFDNLRDVHSFGSNVLRGNAKNAGIDFMRVAVNTTFGLGGLINIADAAGMQNNKNTLGDTFASWGWKNSNYVVVPLFGPSTMRDGVGSAITTVYSPESALIGDKVARYGMMTANAVDKYESVMDFNGALDSASLDKYVAMRDAYIGLRNHQLGIAAPTEEELVDPENPETLAKETLATGTLPEEITSQPAITEPIEQ